MMSAQSRLAQGNADEETQEKLKTLFEAFVNFQNLKDVPGILSCLHEESQALSSMQKSLEGLMNHFTLHVGIVDQTYAGTDGCYAYCRFTQMIEKISGPEFRDMEVENLIVFRRQQDGEWKMWNYLPLWMRQL